MGVLDWLEEAVYGQLNIWLVGLIMLTVVVAVVEPWKKKDDDDD